MLNVRVCGVQVRVDECSVAIKSVELQLVRVETCGHAEGVSRDGTVMSPATTRGPTSHVFIV